ncbi:MAG: EamA family transporter [Myxococcota bacterium]
MGFILCFGCAVAFSGLDASRKHLLQTFDPLTLLALLSAAQGLVYVGWVGASAWRVLPEYIPLGASVVVLQILANLLLLKALSISSLSRIIPFLSLTPVLTGLFGQATLGQAPSSFQWIGIFSVTIGTLMLSWVRGAAEAPGFDKGTVMTLGVTLIWSATAALDKLAIERSNSASHALVQASAMAVVLLGYTWLRGRFNELLLLRRHGGAFALAVFFGSSALALQFMAIETVWVSLVETIKRGTGSFLALVIGRMRFQEPLGVRKVLAVGLIVLGTSLVLLADNR